MDILQQIIEADKAAAARVQALREESERRLSESGKAAAQANSLLISSEQQKLDKQRAEQEKTLSEKQNSAGEVLAAQTKRLEDIFAANRSEWSSEIMKKVTGV